MHYLVIAILVIGVVIWLGKRALFAPKVNAVLTLICAIFFSFGIMSIIRENIYTMLVGLNIYIHIGIIIADCIHDYKYADDLYEDIDIKIDRFFAIKSVLSILTLGYARIIYFGIVNPFISRSVLANIKMMLQSDQRLPYKQLFSDSKIKNYYYGEHIQQLEQKGVVVSNIQTVSKESKIRRENLDKLYPQKIVDKIVDMVAGDSDLKSLRKSAEERLQPKSLMKCYAYLKTSTFERYSQRVTEVMSEKGAYSVKDILNFEELKVFNFTDKDSDWGEYFIIKALQPLVLDGTFIRENYNDNDPFDNPSYQHTGSTVVMPSIDADNDPLLALDDD